MGDNEWSKRFQPPSQKRNHEPRLREGRLRTCRQRIVFTSWILAASLCAWSEASGTSPRIERIGREAGPLPDVVTALCLDRTGLLWIGSRVGLLLFDGQTLRTFEYDVADPTSISDNAIRTIYEDRRGDLWIGTNSGGLNRLDRARWRFQRYRHDSADPGTLSHDSVYAVVEDHDGSLWVGTQQGLNRFDRKTGTFRRFLSNPADPKALASDYIITLYEDRGGRLWIGTLGGGLSRWEPDQGIFTSFRNNPLDPHSLGDDRVSALLEEPAGTLWVGTVRGVNRMDSSDGSFRRFPASGEGPLVKALVPGRSGSLWVGTHAGGLQELDVKTGALRG